MDKGTKNILIASGILLAGAGLIFGGYKLLIENPVVIGTNPDELKGYDLKILALRNKMNTYTSTERENLIRTKLPTEADRYKVLALLNQFNNNRANMTETEKQQLYQMMNLIFNT